MRYVQIFRWGRKYTCMSSVWIRTETLTAWLLSSGPPFPVSDECKCDETYKLNNIPINLELLTLKVKIRKPKMFMSWALLGYLKKTKNLAFYKKTNSATENLTFARILGEICLLLVHSEALIYSEIMPSMKNATKQVNTPAVTSALTNCRRQRRGTDLSIYWHFIPRSIIICTLELGTNNSSNIHKMSYIVHICPKTCA